LIKEEKEKEEEKREGKGWGVKRFRLLSLFV
jgi:hypothetical protein